MGQTLSEPITAKETQSLQNRRVRVGSSAMQGWRTSMEDASTHILALRDDPDSMYFGVFDGHGGSRVAIAAAAELHKHILAQVEDYAQGRVPDAITKGFVKFDEVLRSQESIREDTAGSTAIVALIKNDVVYVGNAGDSRCVASVNGVAEPLSFDHKPMDDEEKSRIEKAGGFVEFNRINGNLALSRALGDFMYKRSDWLACHEQMVSCVPQVTQRPLEDDLDFLILACDGIWDVLSNQEAVDFVTKRVGEGLPPETICEQIMMRCLAPDGGMSGVGCDNMTVIIVCLLHDKPYQRLVDKCALLSKQMGLGGGQSDDMASSTSDDENLGFVNVGSNIKDSNIRAKDTDESVDQSNNAPNNEDSGKNAATDDATSKDNLDTVVATSSDTNNSSNDDVTKGSPVAIKEESKVNNVANEGTNYEIKDSEAKSE